jgi:hypothetical protein
MQFDPDSGGSAIRKEMEMGSLRATASCIGIGGGFSVMKDFFGLSSGGDGPFDAARGGDAASAGGECSR